MPPLVDSFPYPWPLPEAQQLHMALSELYPNSQGARFIAAKAGLNIAMLYFDQPPYLVWKDILDAGAAATLNRKVLEVARDQNPTNARRPFFDALLAAQQQPVAVDSQPRGMDGAPRFLKATDEVTEPEALLYHDDLTLAIGRVPWLIGVLQRLVAVGPAVCLMKVSALTGAQTFSQTGTGFRIADDLLLTNWHVLHVRGVKATAVTVEFGFEDDGKDGGLASTAIACDVSTIEGAAADDWAVIKVVTPLTSAIPIIKLSEAVLPVDNAPAFIVQHPGGQRKRVAFVRNQITSFDDQVVQYLSDTQTGSSGSPVFDDQGRLVALHHAGGRPQEVAGRPPVRKNEGIRIPRVVSGLQQLQIPLP
jgi:hypothetical protein